MEISSLDVHAETGGPRIARRYYYYRRPCVPTVGFEPMRRHKLVLYDMQQNGYFCVNDLLCDVDTCFMHNSFPNTEIEHCRQSLPPCKSAISPSGQIVNRNLKIKLKVTVMDKMGDIVTNIDFESCTEGQMQVNTIIWTVPNFKILLNNKTTRDLRADNIKEALQDSNSSRFYLKMQFLGCNNDIIEIYYLFPDPVFLKYHFYIIHGYGEKYIGKKKFHTIQANKWHYIFTMFKKDNYPLDNGNLKLKFVFTVSKDFKVEHTNVSEAQLSMSNDFESLLNNGLFSDVTMKSIEGTEFKVHKVVLASRSVVLKAHFEHNTTECHTNIIESALEEEVLKEVLTFIYSDKAPRVDDMPEKLLDAADYYQLSRLKILCEEALYKKLTVENAIETLQLADIHSANILKKLTLEFIKGRQAKLVTETEGWEKVKSVDLIKTVCKYIVNDDVDTDV